MGESYSTFETQDRYVTAHATRMGKQTRLEKNMVARTNAPAISRVSQQFDHASENSLNLPGIATMTGARISAVITVPTVRSTTVTVSARHATIAAGRATAVATTSATHTVAATSFTAESAIFLVARLASGQFNSYS